MGKNQTQETIDQRLKTKDFSLEAIVSSLKSPLVILAGAVILLGIVLRLYRIAQNEFVFYDEGYYLNYNRQIMQLIATHPAHSLGEFFQAFGVYCRSSLAGAKALWFFIINLRIYLLGFDAWYFPRLVSAFSGILTIGLLYRFSRRFYNSLRVGGLAATLLAVLPSHVFYSRLAMQEAFSAFLVLGGFYLYVIPKRFGWRSFAAGVFFAAAYFSNYRLIILPALVFFSEFYLSLCQKSKPDLRHFVWFLVAFLICVFGIGSLDGGKNIFITFGWMFHQANLAQDQFAFVNFLSFPYYLFRLENLLFGMVFFSSAWLLFAKRYRSAFPFVLVCLYMVLFSFASEKGARYLCVMLPFIALAVAEMVNIVLFEISSLQYRRVGQVMLAVLVAALAVKSSQIAFSHSDYTRSAKEILAQGKHVRYVSTQNYVQNLFVNNPDDIAGCPENFEGLLKLYQQGCRYLVLCPQAYVSCGKDDERFNPELKGYLEFIRRTISPVKVYKHFSPALMERFVFDHNENLPRSIRFIRLNQEKGFHEIRIYDLAAVITETLKVLSKHGVQKP